MFRKLTKLPTSPITITSLKELPPPPPGKTGWPWTEESSQLPDTIYPVESKAYSTGMPDGRPWPKISIVTPNYNYGHFLKELIHLSGG